MHLRIQQCACPVIAFASMYTCALCLVGDDTRSSAQLWMSHFIRMQDRRSDLGYPAGLAPASMENNGRISLVSTLVPSKT